MTSETLPFKQASPLVNFAKIPVRHLRRARIKIANLSKKVRFSNSFFIGKNADVYVPDFFEVCEHVSIAANFLSQVNVVIGPHCLISTNVSFIGKDHDVLNAQSAFLSGRTSPSTIILEGNNFIGFGATIMGNVKIGKGAIVGAHSLVLSDVPEYQVVAGLPARLIKMRNMQSD